MSVPNPATHDPMSDDDIAHDRYNACERPEAPFTDRTYISVECRSCMVALGAFARADADARLLGRLGNAPTAVALYNRFCGHHGLPPIAIVIQEGTP